MLLKRYVHFMLGLIGCCALAMPGFSAEQTATIDSAYLTVDTRGKDRRDDRHEDRDDRQECRQEEGRVGNEKRDCKQDNRSEPDPGPEV